MIQFNPSISRIVVDPTMGWYVMQVGSVTAHVAGDRGEIVNILRLIEQSGASEKQIEQTLRGAQGHFALIVEGSDYLICAVDKNRSIPIFFSKIDNEVVVSNSADLLRSKLTFCDVDSDTIQEILMAGYVTGNKTAIRGLYQLLPGEFLWKAGSDGFHRKRYYMYLPENGEVESSTNLNERLSEVTDRAIRNAISIADGRPIIVPLSGGLDSRLILCKLHQFGYKNLKAYSYGMKFNFDAMVAKKVAMNLGVSWKFIHSEPRENKKFFWSKERREYWRLADGLCSIPSIQDVAQLINNKYKSFFPDDSIFMNGQSGDFITGGHIPQKLSKPTVTDDEIIDEIVSRHFSLWRSMKTEIVVSKIKSSIEELFTSCREINPFVPGASLYEAWEWQERQCKYVVNSARIYDYAGRNWQMPLWYGDYMDFWKSVPVRYKLNQRLYKDFLKRWNYRNLFNNIDRTVWRWPGVSFGALPLGWLIGKLFGDYRKQQFYDRARYFGHYAFVYQIYGWKMFSHVCDDIRNPVALMARTWVEELQSQSGAV